MSESKEEMDVIDKMMNAGADIIGAGENAAKKLVKKAKVKKE